ncbi:MAG: 6-phosphogluconolactonase [Phycisphaeraceae bacterium]|nr:6-phosphogluconolactonase [Phycisphaeraceae bacterium]
MMSGDSNVGGLPGTAMVASDADKAVAHLAEAFAGAVSEAVESRGQAHVAFSGGSTPKPLLLLLGTSKKFARLPWSQLQVWLVDERWVSLEDERSNYRMIRHCLLDRVPVRENHCHPVPVEFEDAPVRYEAELRLALGVDQGFPSLDMVVLGMGDDAHTASLFPGSSALEVEDRCFVKSSGPTVTPPDRVTMTYPLINHARQVAALVLGAGKHATLRRVADAADRPDAFRGLPILGVRPVASPMVWYLDRPAADGS